MSNEHDAALTMTHPECGIAVFLPTFFKECPLELKSMWHSLNKCWGIGTGTVVSVLCQAHPIKIFECGDMADRLAPCSIIFRSFTDICVAIVHFPCIIVYTMNGMFYVWLQNSQKITIIIIINKQVA